MVGDRNCSNCRTPSSVHNARLGGGGGHRSRVPTPLTIIMQVASPPHLKTEGVSLQMVNCAVAEVSSKKEQLCNVEVAIGNNFF